MLERYEYDAYGTCRIYKAWDSSAGCEARSVVGASLALGGGNPIRYSGYPFDEETGLYHVRNRMYSAGLQRWLQRDPLGDPMHNAGSSVPVFTHGYHATETESVYMPRVHDEANLYQYALSCPVNYTDPSGLRCGPCVFKSQTGWVIDSRTTPISFRNAIECWWRTEIKCDKNCLYCFSSKTVPCKYKEVTTKAITPSPPAGPRVGMPLTAFCTMTFPGGPPGVPVPRLSCPPE
jgi:RHS repeat-associated protein